MQLKRPTPDDVVIFCYTSGTTGDPKGSMISHSYFMTVCLCVDSYHYQFTNMDCAISYLPYAHIFEQAVFNYAIFFGTKFGYY